MNLDLLRKKISKAAALTNRKLDDIKLVAVTKFVDVARIEETIKEGIIAIGENRVQEAKEKRDTFHLIDKVEWHMVGHLQTNKVKDAVRIFDLIHSIDSLKLAEKLNEEGKKINKIVKGLIQVNTSGEDTKFGLKKEEIDNVLKEIANMTNLTIEGLMTIAPFASDENLIRQCFRELRLLSESIDNKFKNVTMKYLSMGMTNDFEIAISEGANIIRIGTAIFGERK